MGCETNFKWFERFHYSGGKHGHGASNHGTRVADKRQCGNLPPAHTFRSSTCSNFFIINVGGRDPGEDCHSLLAPTDSSNRSVSVHADSPGDAQRSQGPGSSALATQPAPVRACDNASRSPAPVALTLLGPGSHETSGVPVWVSRKDMS